jgi:predicted acyltransferase
MWFSMKRYGHDLNTRSAVKIIYRTAVIFLAGFLIQLFPFIGKDLSTVRIMGVLQRIALAYGFGALICILVKRKHLWLVTAIILLGYWALLSFLGGSDPYSLEGNFALVADRAILGERHLYGGFGIKFDPEGLLSTIPAIGTVIIGYLAGSMLGRGAANAVNVLKMAIYGLIAIGAGLVWSIWFPINKPLWTSSYVLYTGGISLLILALLYLLIDVLMLKRWSAFFRVLGMNALFIYIMAGLWTKVMMLIKISGDDTSISLYRWIYMNLCVPLFGNLNGSLMFAVMQVLILWLLGLVLYKKKVFIKV